MLRALDIFLAAFHILLVLFNISGWIWKRTRRLHLYTIGITLASWLILGIWYGLGYCPLTDWHWNIKEQLGEQNLPASFIKYYADKLSGKNIDSGLVDIATASVLIAVLIITIYTNFLRKGSVQK